MHIDRSGQPTSSNAGHTGRGDDLTAIRGITRTIAAKLETMGVVSFAQIAQWDFAQVQLVSTQLDLGRRVSKQNWIEQAAQLELRGGSAPPLLDGNLRPVAVPAKPQEPEPEFGATLKTEEAFGGAPEDNFKDTYKSASGTPTFVLEDISGITVSLSSKLAAGGIAKPLQIAQWTAGDVAWWKSVLGATARIQKDNWIAQAAILATGVPTHYATRRQTELPCNSEETRTIVLEPPDTQPTQNNFASAPFDGPSQRLRVLRIERRAPGAGCKPIVRVRVMPRKGQAVQSETTSAETACQDDVQAQITKQQQLPEVSCTYGDQELTARADDGAHVFIEGPVTSANGVGQASLMTGSQAPGHEFEQAAPSRSRFYHSSEYFFGTIPSEASVEIVNPGARRDTENESQRDNATAGIDQTHARGVARFLKTLLGS